MVRFLICSLVFIIGSFTAATADQGMGSYSDQLECVTVECAQAHNKPHQGEYAKYMPLLTSDIFQCPVDSGKSEWLYVHFGSSAPGAFYKISVEEETHVLKVMIPSEYVAYEAAMVGVLCNAAGPCVTHDQQEMETVLAHHLPGYDPQAMPWENKCAV